MPSSSSPPTEREWQSRLDECLSQSVAEAGTRITQARAVQSWLRRASTEAAESLRQQPGAQGRMGGYARMKEDFEDAFPNLVAAVDRLTEGCAALDLELQPLRPTQSRVVLAFPGDFSVDVFCRLSSCNLEAATSTLNTVADALPEGTPFPNRPKSVTGFVARNGSGLGVRVLERTDREGGARYQRVSLLPVDGSAVEGLSRDAAARRLCRQLCPSSTS